MTLLNVLIRDVNEDVLADLVELFRQYDHILSLTVQSDDVYRPRRRIGFHGQGTFRSMRRPSIIRRQSGGMLEPSDLPIGLPPIRSAIESVTC